MSYKLYASGHDGYVLLLKNDDLSKVCKRIDKEFKSNDFTKYLLIENENNADFPIGLFFYEDDYNKFKQKYIKKK